MDEVVKMEAKKLEEMSREELIGALKEAQKGGDWAEQKHKDLLELANRIGVDVDEALEVNKVGLVVVTGVFYCIAAAVAIFPVWGCIYTLVEEGYRLSRVPWVLIPAFWIPAYGVFWVAKKNWRIQHKIFDGRNASGLRPPVG
ncbi:MAG: hypothetical protein A2600_14100 [Candidatus Lambdaproteobacteria bacterium RIFOXYD1_FULL_56_27]|uniref:Uncharacterized protein n=1 Tax=Candidatus Lambdaproteobacteria bacterium RIFOXYD2_FULL_56_26 TaxID=1817773 RepID=A0A1F6H125_9PROT|nr:MAG: hypothetical protein A2557_14135 [Candidatus Lambdaproteobacteria bacterium RIFOXYD2_FULL_56_26]OGH08269.1 MAG: hypothetical protein A2600_14100 [Candidatus Lambdaproteobacteria bacterium RIFOXYD1_FULL_56_27]